MTDRILAIDPGNKQSAYCFYDPDTRTLSGCGIVLNDDMLGIIMAAAANGNDLAIEKIAAMGMAVGAEVFDTCEWIGRFVERYATYSGSGTQNIHMVKRAEEKIHLCGSMRAKDPNIRQAILDRYGGREAAMGHKASKKRPAAPGPLAGVKDDIWSALAVAITAAETMGAGIDAVATCGPVRAEG
jgi:hypothetical protein